MTVRSLVETAALALFVVAALSLVLGHLLGAPFLLGYVETGSMTGTIDPGDGFVAVPSALAGPIHEGDVVTYRAKSVQGGGLITHRVVGRTDRGFVTKGDANPVADQANEEPPVKRAQIVAKALRVGGNVVVIPHLGDAATAVQRAIRLVQGYLASALGTTAVLGTSGLSYLFFGATVAYYLVDARRAHDAKDRTRSRSRGTWNARRMSALLALLVVAAATAGMVLPSGAHEFGFVSGDADASGVHVVRAGTTETATYSVTAGHLPVYSFVRSSGAFVHVAPHVLVVASGATAETTLTVDAPRQLGYYRQYVTEHRYIAALPLSVVRSLHRIHPWLPILAIDAELWGAFYLLGVALAGPGRARVRARPGSRARGLRARIRRLLSR